MRRSYGWQRDRPDFRNWRFAVRPEIARKLPPSIDLRPLMPPVYDQGQLGSCTANAIAAAFEYEQARCKLPQWTPSRLFIYYNERDMEGAVSSDSGAPLADGIKSINQIGVCPEVMWAYDPTEFTTRPPQSAYDDALANKSLAYYSVAQDLTAIRTALASGYTVTMGFTVYDSFESDAVAASGIVPMPSPDENVVGGHAVLIVGYHMGTGNAICRNSWSASWGTAGYFSMPFAYVLDPNLASDFWVIQRVS